MKTIFATTHFTVWISRCPEGLIELTGEFDLASVPVFEAAVRELGIACRSRLVLDLRRLAFIDAAGLHAVLDLHEVCLGLGAALSVLPGRRSVQRVFELAGVEQLVPFSGSRSPT